MCLSTAVDTTISQAPNTRKPDSKESGFFTSVKNEMRSSYLGILLASVEQAKDIL